jgi:hypothetical protein
MQYLKLFEEFQQELIEKKEEKEQVEESSTDSYPAPEYVVQPAPGDKGFAMFKHAFDNKKKRFETGFFSTTVNNY